MHKIFAVVLITAVIFVLTTPVHALESAHTLKWNIYGGYGLLQTPDISDFESPMSGGPNGGVQAFFDKGTNLMLYSSRSHVPRVLEL